MKYLVLFALLVTFSCKNNNQPAIKETASTGETVTKTETSTVISQEVKKDSLKTAPADSLYRLVVLFYSIGSGAEYPLINEFVDSIGMYGQNIGKKIEFTRKSWGREGETDVVMRLKELSTAQQTDFITMSRRVLAKGKYVNIYENYPYHTRGK